MLFISYWSRIQLGIISGATLRWDQQSWRPDQQETRQGSTGYVCHEADRCTRQWQNCSVTKSCPTLCDLKDCSTPGVLSFTISWSLLKLMSIKSVMLSNRLVLHCLPLLLSSVFPSIRVFYSESALCIRWPKHWSFSFSISPFNEYSIWLPLRLTGLISLLSKGLSSLL